MVTFTINGKEYKADTSFYVLYEYSKITKIDYFDDLVSSLTPDKDGKIKVSMFMNFSNLITAGIRAGGADVDVKDVFNAMPLIANTTAVEYFNELLRSWNAVNEEPEQKKTTDKD